MPTLELAVGGTYARLRGGGGSQRGGGQRGVISGFSKQARKRMLDLLNQVEQGSLSSGLFLTLTYPDHFPRDAARWKRDLDVFLKRAKRRYPKSVWIWRLEWKARLSGENKGEIAPHFHLLGLGISRLSLRWLSEGWYEVVGSGDLRHLGAGTQAQRIRSRRGIMYYASKYMGKVAESYEGWTGRCWGIVGRELLPVVLVLIELTWKQWYRIRRVLRGWLEAKRGRKAWGRLRGQGLTAYMGDEPASRLVSWVLAQ